MLAGIFAALAGYERDLMHERAAAARQAARLGGPAHWPAAPAQLEAPAQLGASASDLGAARRR